MKRFLVAIILLLTALFISTCSDSDDDNNDSAITFPLEVGTTWRYLISMPYYNYDTATIDTIAYYAMLSADSLVQTPTGIITTCINSWEEGYETHMSADYVAYADDGLRLYGTSGTGGVPIVFAAPKQIIKSRGITVPGDYGILKWYIDLPDSNANLILPRPTIAEFAWTFQPDAEEWIASEHDIVGTETLETALGSQTCIHKHIFISFGDEENYDYDYYYSNKGIIYSWFDLGMQRVHNEYGVVVAQYYAWQKYELVEYTPGR